MHSSLIPLPQPLVETAGKSQARCLSHQAELVSHEHIPHEGHISQSSHPKHVWVSLVAAGMGVCVHGRVCVRLWSAAGAGQALSFLQPALLRSPTTAPTSLSTKRLRKENTEPGLLTRGTALLFLSGSPWLFSVPANPCLHLGRSCI